MAQNNFIDIKVDESKLRAVERQVREIPGAMKRIVPPAINITATTARATTARAIAEQIKWQVTQVKKGISIIKARRNIWTARVKVTSKEIPLILFGARQTKNGVSYQIDKRAGRKTIKGAFIQTMPTTGEKQKNGHKGVFLRRRSAKTSEGRDTKGRLRKGRLPIKEQYGPSLGIVFEDAASIAADITASAGALLEKNIDSKVQWILSKYGRAG